MRVFYLWKQFIGIVNMTNSIFWCYFNHSLKHRKFLWASLQVFPGQHATESNSRQSWIGTSLGSRLLNTAEELSRLADLHLWVYLILLLYCFLTSPGIYYISQFHIFPNFSNHFYLLSLLQLASEPPHNQNSFHFAQPDGHFSLLAFFLDFSAIFYTMISGNTLFLYHLQNDNFLIFLLFALFFAGSF